MSFLQSIAQYKKICIQCHNNPDADCLASAYGLYRYLTDHGCKVCVLYGGDNPIKKNDLKLLIDECSLPLEHRHSIPDTELLLMIDCQYRGGNSEVFCADNIVVIDHHPVCCTPPEKHFIDSSYQSCSTIVWEMLSHEGYEIDSLLASALLYGLYTDTALFSDLYFRRDTEMKLELYDRQPLFEKLAKSNMTLAELMVAIEAMHNHILNIDNRFAIVEAISCEQSILGAIGDFMLQADIVLLCFTYTSSGNGYRISIRSCDDTIPANQAAEFLCRNVGSGGGHKNKAGGYIDKAKLVSRYGDLPTSEIIEKLLTEYIESKTNKSI